MTKKEIKAPVDSLKDEIKKIEIEMMNLRLLFARKESESRAIIIKIKDLTAKKEQLKEQLTGE